MASLTVAHHDSHQSCNTQVERQVEREEAYGDKYVSRQTHHAHHVIGLVIEDSYWSVGHDQGHEDTRRSEPWPEGQDDALQTWRDRQSEAVPGEAPVAFPQVKDVEGHQFPTYNKKYAVISDDLKNNSVKFYNTLRNS